MPQPTDPFSIDKLAVISRLLQNPQALSNVQLQWLRNQYPPTDYMQGVLAPYEHQAFAREITQGSPAAGIGLGVVGIPAYQQAKAIGLLGSRTGFDPDQIFAGWRGIRQGLLSTGGP